MQWTGFISRMALTALSGVIFCATAAICEPFSTHYKWRYMNESPEAIAEASNAIKLHPTDPEAYLKRSQARGDAKKSLHLALSDIRKAIALGGRHSLYFFREACVLDAMEEDEPALIAIDNAGALESHSGQYWNLRSIIFYHMRKNEEALRSADEAVRYDPRNPGYRLFKARALKGQGKLEASLKEIETVLTLEPKNRSALKEKLDLLQRLKQWQMAVPCATLLVSLEKDPIELRFIRQSQANCYSHLKDFPKAAAALKPKD